MHALLMWAVKSLVYSSIMWLIFAQFCCIRPDLEGRWIEAQRELGTKLG